MLPGPNNVSSRSSFVPSQSSDNCNFSGKVAAVSGGGCPLMIGGGGGTTASRSSLLSSPPGNSKSQHLENILQNHISMLAI